MPGDTTWFTKARFGMFIHWGLYAVPAREAGEWIMDREKIPPEEYRQKYLQDFTADAFDPEEWATLAARAGMRYAVLTTKHHDGFCLWDSAHTDYKATNSGAKRDLVRPWAEAFRAKGIYAGLYYSLIDWSHPDFVLDRIVGPFRDLPEADMAKHNVGRDQRRYAAYMRAQTTELLTQYGDIDVMWFDFSYPNHMPERGRGKGAPEWESEELVKVIRSLRPGIVIDDRLDLPGSGDFASPEQFMPRIPMEKEGKRIVWESCQTMGGSWGYVRDTNGWRDSAEIIRTLVDTVSKNGNLLLNVGPDAHGRLCPRTKERLQAIGDWMQYHAPAIHGCGPAPEGLITPPDCRYTYDATKNILYVAVFAWPFKFLHLDGLAGKVRSARLMLDGSELPMHGLDESQRRRAVGAGFGPDLLSLNIPIAQPATPVPVIALQLK